MESLSVEVHKDDIWNNDKNGEKDDVQIHGLTNKSILFTFFHAKVSGKKGKNEIR